MSSLSKKVSQIRKAEILSRKEFGGAVNISARAIEAIENKGVEPKSSYLESILALFPEYCLWLMLDEVDIEKGQISPMIKDLWRQWVLLKKGDINFDRLDDEKKLEVKYVLEEFNNGSTDVEFRDDLQWPYIKTL